ncbi:MAG: FKBP-type peptidyl-prolyl cis-trans isomerase [Bacteroidales bacterium]|nr:FKBP-type peptidyl-prolyl cis-trans isomerase [Bacteroidales bacterium]MCF8458500.1 FKBP-type peptidyl-prolyl cis-trans isomerase [Bacteroidales bacterium]
MKRLAWTTLIIITLFMGTISCGEKILWETHESGLQYAFITRSELGSAVKEGDVLVLKMKYKTEQDSVLFDTNEIPGPYRMQFKKPSHLGGSVEDAFSIMHVGDSINFKVNAKQFYEHTLHSDLPKVIDPTSNIIFEVRLQGIQSINQIKDERRALQSHNAEEEQKMLDNYLKLTNVTVEPTMSGLYYIELEAGSGKSAVPGQKVTVHYTGKFIDGAIFDSSLKRNEPFRFMLGANEVIAGLEEGIAKMKVGGKARLIIPSMLAYEDKQHGPVPPFSTLIFEIELLKVE